MSYSLTYTQAILVVVYVADKIRQGLHEYVPNRAIAHSLGIPPPTTAKILQALARAGIIETREGVKGGVRLAIPARNVTLSDILMAMEQQRPLFQTNLNVRAIGQRPSRAQQAIRKALEGAEESMRASLDKTTIQEILAHFGAG
jgi:Rrf2 family protein